MPLNIVFFEASKLVSTKTLLLKHYYRRQGLCNYNFSGGVVRNMCRGIKQYAYEWPDLLQRCRTPESRKLLRGGCLAHHSVSLSETYGPMSSKKPMNVSASFKQRAQMSRKEPFHLTLCWPVWKAPGLIEEAPARGAREGAWGSAWEGARESAWEGARYLFLVLEKEDEHFPEHPPRAPERPTSGGPAPSVAGQSTRNIRADFWLKGMRRSTF